MISDCEEFDFVIAVSGTSGTILASKLVKLNFTVLLVEAGDKPTTETQWPGLFQYTKGTDYDWQFTYDDYNNNILSSHKLQQGKVLGGSSQVGYMFYGVPNPKYYDEWARLINDPSWNFKNVLPLFKRNENVTDEVILNSSDIIYHGKNGNIKLKKYHSDLNTCYFKSYREFGYDVVEDINPKNTLGYTNIFFSIGDGKRQSEVYKFLSHEKDNPNLRVLYKSQVTKILFDSKKRAVGVNILTKDKKLITVKARKEIIISAGVIKTPQLLMLSDIGPKTHLEEKGIKVISNLPVGNKMREPTVTVLVYVMGKRKNLGKPNLHEFLSPVIHGYVAVNKSQNYADYETLSGVLESSQVFLEICSIVYSINNEICDRLKNAALGREINYLAHNLLNPRSCGKVFLNSTNPEDQPIINLGRYSNEKDLEDHAKFIEHYNGILKTDYYKSVNAKLADPKLEACRGIKRDTREYWKCYAQGMVSTLHNFVGTCPMGSVVDSRLCVIGVERLREVDASVIPITVGVTVQSNVMMVAQKAFDMIKQDYGV